MARETELDYLRHDVAALRGVLTDNPEWSKPLADLTDPDRHTRYLVVANLAWRVWDHAIAVDTLLHEELYVPATVLLRSIYETLATLAYIVKHNRSQDEAIILLAFSYLNQVEHFAHQPDFVREIKGILGKMPAKLVSEARARAARRPHTWSGKTMRQLTEAAGVTGYAEAYGYFSSESHGTMVGHHVRIVRDADGKGRIQTGRSVSQLDVESAANMARRALHSAFKLLWRVFDGPPIKFPSTDPEKWMHRSK